MKSEIFNFPLLSLGEVYITLCKKFETVTLGPEVSFRCRLGDVVFVPDHTPKFVLLFFSSIERSPCVQYLKSLCVKLLLISRQQISRKGGSFCSGWRFGEDIKSLIEIKTRKKVQGLHGTGSSVCASTMRCFQLENIRSTEREVAG